MRQPRSIRVRSVFAGTLAVAAAVAIGAGSPSDDASVASAVAVIVPDLPKAHVRFLSHDLLRGRDTGDVGYELAREYVVAQFARIGLRPANGASYLQEFELLEVAADAGSALTIGSTTLAAPDVRVTPAWASGRDTWEGAAVFVRHGLVTHGRDDYGGADVRGKAVVMLSTLPEGWTADRDRARAAAARAEIARRKGAALVIELTPGEARPPVASEAAQPRRTLALADGSTTRVPVDASVVGPSARDLVRSWQPSSPSPGGGAQTPLEVGRIRLIRAHDLKRLRSWNVVGLVPGSDPARRDESVVLTAHLDHIGIVAPDASGDRICNGTHDNAIGTAQLLAAAEAMVRLKPPRTIVFVALGAEERGLFGSWYYVRNPVRPIEKTVANINLDGGREGAITDDVIDNAADVSDMKAIVRDVMAAQRVGVTEDRSPAAVVGFSSDHYSFLLAGVPTVDLKPGYSVNGDAEIGWKDRMTYYDTLRHKPADNFDESFTFESPAEMARRTVRLAWHLATMTGMPQMLDGHVMHRPRSRPRAPYYFGPRANIGATSGR